MSQETKDWWEYSSAGYQAECRIPVGVHYGPGSPDERELNLLGPVAGLDVLELGCGGAQCSVAFAQQGARVTAIDISEAQLAFARELAAAHAVRVDFHQGDIRALPQVAAASQDLVFSAFALLYVDDLSSCFAEVQRVLRPGGRFVFSNDHPFYRTVDAATLALQGSYFDTGKVIKTFGDPTKKFVLYTHTVGELFAAVTGAGLAVEKLLEPDSRIRFPTDPWYGLWDYRPETLALVPPTIIFACRKPA